MQLFLLFTKQPTLIRRSTVLYLPLQLEFPVLTITCQSVCLWERFVLRIVTLIHILVLHLKVRICSADQNKHLKGLHFQNRLILLEQILEAVNACQRQTLQLNFLQFHSRKKKFLKKFNNFFFANLLTCCSIQIRTGNIKPL